MKINKCYFDVLACLLFSIRTSIEKDKSVFDNYVLISTEQIAKKLGYNEKKVIKAIYKAKKEGVIDLSKVHENKYEISIKNFYKKSVKNGKPTS